MDSRAAERLIRSLSFDVEAIPQQDNALKTTDSKNQAPMNLKIRVHKKEGMVLQKNTILTIPNISHPERAPERVRLASSDTTLMSFDVLMETDSEKRPVKKHRKLFGRCFGTQSDDEEPPYEPSSAKKDIKSDTNLTLQKGNNKEIENTVLIDSKNTKFFGKCKPGGCLDPPFGEDKYQYKPTIAKDSSKNIKIITSKDKITNKRLSKEGTSQDNVITTPELDIIASKAVQGRSSRDNSPEKYEENIRDSRYYVLEPIIIISGENSKELKTMKRSSKESSPYSNRLAYEKNSNYSQDMQQVPDKDTRTSILLINENVTHTSNIRSNNILKRASKDHSPEPNKQISTSEPDKSYGRDSRDHITAIDKRKIDKDKMSSREHSPDQNRQILITGPGPHVYYDNGTTGQDPNPKELEQLNNQKSEEYYEKGSRDGCTPTVDIHRGVKNSSREHSPESNMLTKKSEVGKTGTIQDDESKYMSTGGSEIPENTAIQNIGSNSLSKDVDKPDIKRADVVKDRDTFATKQKKLNKQESHEVSGDISNIVIDDTDSIITYPPEISSSDFEEKKVEKKGTSKRNSITSERARSSVIEFPNKYFSPPKRNKTRDSYGSIFNTSQDNVFIGPSEIQPKSPITDISEYPLKERKSLESLGWEKSQVNKTTDILKKSPYPVSTDSDTGEDMQNLMTHNEMYEFNEADGTQKSATLPMCSEEIDRQRSDGNTSKNDTVYPQSTNLAKVSETNTQSKNISNSGSSYTNINADIGSKTDSKNSPILDRVSENQYYKESSISNRDSSNRVKDHNFGQDPLNYAQSTIEPTFGKNNKDFALLDNMNNYSSSNHTGIIFQDTKSDFSDVNSSAKYSSRGNNEAIPNYNNSFVGEQNKYEMSRNDTNEYRNYKPDEESTSPHYEEDNYYVSTTDAENKSPSGYQNSVDINSFRALEEVSKADSNDIKSKSYHSGDSTLKVKENFTQLYTKQTVESHDEGSIKSKNWQDISKKLIDNKRETQPDYYDSQSRSGSSKQVDSIYLELSITHESKEDASLISSSSRTKVIKTVLNVQNDKIRIPIDDQNELSIQYKKVVPGSVASSQRIQFLLPGSESQSRQETAFLNSMHSSNVKDDRTGDAKGTPLYPMLSLERLGKDLRETLSFVYDKQLVPLQNTIKSLKEDIDFLSSQQLLLRDRIHGTASSRRIRPVRLIHSSKRCVCSMHRESSILKSRTIH